MSADASFSILYKLGALPLDFKILLDIYHDWSICTMLWEDKFTLVNISSCGRCNLRNHREINNGEKYIILESLTILIVCTKGKSHLHNQIITWEDQIGE